MLSTSEPLESLIQELDSGNRQTVLEFVQYLLNKQKENVFRRGSASVLLKFPNGQLMVTKEETAELHGVTLEERGLVPEDAALSEKNGIAAFQKFLEEPPLFTSEEADEFDRIIQEAREATMTDC